MVGAAQKNQHQVLCLKLHYELKGIPLTSNSGLTPSKILRAKSARITDSNLDHLVENHFALLELGNQRDLIAQLEGGKNWLFDNRERLNTEDYDPELPTSIIERRLSEDQLLALQEETDSRFIAGDDVNQIKFGNVRFRDLTQTLAHTLNTLLEPRRSMRLFQSGRNWYPPGGYMGWHTNANVQGFRLYCSHAAVPGASFFRFQDPNSKTIVTSWDEAGWNFRCFRTDLEPLWHCVYSATDRISFGYGLMFPVDQTSEG